MAKLGKNWLTEHTIDFEYKKYILLAYLKEVGEDFMENRLYPCFSEIIEHYRNLQSLQQSKAFLAEQFPQQLGQIDLESLNLEYKRMMEDDVLMQEIEQIINFSIPRFEEYMDEGRKIYEFIEQHINITQVGLLPLRTDYGYMFLQNGEERETRVFQYELTVFEGPEEKYRGISTRYITSYSRNLRTTFEWMRSDLMRNFMFSGNPATFAIEAELKLPFNETLFPIARRMLIRYISKAS